MGVDIDAFGKDFTCLLEVGGHSYDKSLTTYWRQRNAYWKWGDNSVAGVTLWKGCDLWVAPVRTPPGKGGSPIPFHA